MIVLLNAPPESGKTAMADFVRYNFSQVYIDHLAAPLKQINKIIYSLSDQAVHELDNNHVLKEQPNDVFFGKSWRQVNIDLSKELKTKFGLAYFGESIARRIAAKKPLNTLITDLGFEEEIPPLVKAFGADKLKILQIGRNGFDFSTDSRSYVYGDTYGIETYFIENNGSLGAFHNTAANTLAKLWD